MLYCSKKLERPILSSLGDECSLEQTGIVELGNGLIVKVKDENGNILLNAWDHNGGECAAITQTMTENMYSVYSNFKGGYIEESINISVKGKRVGIVDILFSCDNLHRFVMEIIAIYTELYLASI